MATQVQLRRGTEAENDEFTGAEGEITIDTTNDTIRVHDGVKKGGYKVMKGNTPIVAGSYPVITYDEKGLVTGGRTLTYNDLESANLGDKFVSKPKKSPAGTYAKVKVTESGTVESGEQLLPVDIPLLPISKTEGLEAALSNKSPLLEINVFNNASGSIQLLEGPNVVIMGGSCTLYPPIFTDNTVLRQCLVQIQKTNSSYEITIDAAKYFGGVQPSLTDAGVYNIYLEFDVPTESWVYGAIKKS